MPYASIYICPMPVVYTCIYTRLILIIMTHQSSEDCTLLQEYNIVLLYVYLICICISIFLCVIYDFFYDSNVAVIKKKITYPPRTQTQTSSLEKP
jgi:hypothetical protein